MPISGPFAKRLGLIKDPTGAFAGVNPTSYDLTIGCVIVGGQKYTKEKNDGLMIAPQQTFVIVSKESVNLPPEYLAYAFLRTRMAREGILAINTGIIDPGWNKPIATTAINVAKDAIPIFSYGAFLRIVFHRVEGDPNPPATAPSLPAGAYATENADEYLERQVTASLHYPASFLDVPGQQEKLLKAAREDLIQASWDRVIKLVAVVTIASLLLAGVLPIGASILLSRPSAPVPKQEPIDPKLEARLRAVEQQLQASNKPQDSVAATKTGQSKKTP